MAFEKKYQTTGVKVASPKGLAKWCKVTEPDTRFDPNGTYSVELVCDPNDPAVQAFIEKLTGLRDALFTELKDSLPPAKAKVLQLKEVYSEEVDAEGNETGNIIFKWAMKNVAEKKGSKSIIVVDAHKNIIKPIPLVGNGSLIRCAGYASPYLMELTKQVGVSLKWDSMQLLQLVEYSGGGIDVFDEEEGYVAEQTADIGCDDDDADY